MFDDALAVACDINYFPGCRALINSVFTYHPELPIFVFERGFTEREFSWCATHPAGIHVYSISRFPFFCPGLWEAKQQVFAECVGRARTVCLIDADIVLLSRLDDVFQHAKHGRIVAGCDAMNIYYDDSYAVYGLEMAGRSADGLNSGLVCLDVQAHWDVVGLWAFSSNFAAYSPHGGYPLRLPGFGDQGLLNAIIVRLGKESLCQLLPHGVWHDFRDPRKLRVVESAANGALFVERIATGQRQRIIHSVGEKWWWQSDAVRDERFDYFRHFFELSFAREDVKTLRNGAAATPIARGI